MPARTAYDSFDKSEHSCIRDMGAGITSLGGYEYSEMNMIESSKLLDNLAWVHHHMSVVEHANLTYLIKGTSRGVLQEIVRHRIASYTVRSTRYTMGSVINAFVASQAGGEKEFFISKVLGFDMLVTCNEEYNKIEIGSMYDKLSYQSKTVQDFNNIAVAKSSLPLLEEFSNDSQALFDALEEGKKKRNVGDAFKHIVTDNMKTDMVVTFNLRSLKNYFTLRDSGASYFQIQWLAQAMKEATPKKYLDLIIKENK